MKKTKLTRSLLAACSIVALSAVMYGCSDSGPSQADLDAAEAAAAAAEEAQAAAEAEAAAAEEAAAKEAADRMAAEEAAAKEAADRMAAEEAAAAAEAQAAEDLENTQMAAADAAAAAMTASDNAAASASRAGDATENLATLQTGADANADEMGGNEHADAAQAAADAAAEAASDAEDAAAAAEAATVGADAEAALRMALDAQDAAEKAEAEAETHADEAEKAAMTELHIDGTMKSAGMEQEDGTIVVSSIDADMGMLTKTADDGSKTITGFQGGVERDDVGAVEGEMFVHGADAADDQDYVQTVEARDITIGKTLDTTDDMARLTLVTGRVGSKPYRVFVDDDTAAGAAFLPVAANGAVDHDSSDATDAVTLRSLGMFIEATPNADTSVTGFEADALDFTDIVHAKVGADAAARAEDDAKDNKPVEVFSYVSGTPATTTYVVKLQEQTTGGVVTGVRLQEVHIHALAAPDISRDPGGTDVHERVGVTADVPAMEAYDHIHFGVWSTLSDAEKDGSQTIANLGIGFVQNHDGSGVTQGSIVGTASYSGDWVAAVRRQYASDAEKGAITIRDGEATLTANFSEDEFTGDLDGLAMLEGTLSANTFEGTKATVGDNEFGLDDSGTFEGSFSGAIYGAEGAEAAGVFSFDGDEAGAFTGAFGGRDVDQPVKD